MSLLSIYIVNDVTQNFSNFSQTRETDATIMKRGEYWVSFMNSYWFYNNPLPHLHYFSHAMNPADVLSSTLYTMSSNVTNFQQLITGCRRISKLLVRLLDKTHFTSIIFFLFIYLLIVPKNTNFAQSMYKIS